MAERRTGFGDHHIEDLKISFVPPLPECWRYVPKKDFPLKEDARGR